MENFEWYQQLVKPEWAPPSWLFGPVWSFLYLVIAITFGFVFYKAFTGKIPWLIALPFVLNLIFNFIFTPIQFGLKNNYLASLDIILVLITIIWMMISVYGQFRWVSYAQLPYLIWVSFATVLQLTITYLNR